MKKEVVTKYQLKRLLRMNRLSQKDFADLVGISRSTVVAWGSEAKNGRPVPIWVMILLNYRYSYLFESYIKTLERKEDKK